MDGKLFSGYTDIWDMGGKLKFVNMGGKVGKYAWK